MSDKIKFRCPNCRKMITAPDAAAGRMLPCPNCKKVLPVPGSQWEADTGQEQPILAAPVHDAPPVQQTRHERGQSEPPITQPIAGPQQKTNGCGVAGLTFSIVGWLTCGLLCPLGLILSLVGLSRQPKGAAIAGAIVGGIGSVLLLPVALFFGAGFIAVGRNAIMMAERPHHEAILRTAASYLETPLSIYRLDMGEYPASLEWLVERPDLEHFKSYTEANQWHGPYVSDQSMLLDAWENPLFLDFDQEGEPLIRSAGPDGLAGTVDDMTYSLRLKMITLGR